MTRSFALIAVLAALVFAALPAIASSRPCFTTVCPKPPPASGDRGACLVRFGHFCPPPITWQ